MSKRSVKIFNDKEPIKGIEIIGEKGKYSVYTDSSNEHLSNLRGKSGNLKEVKKMVSSALCGSAPTPAPAPIKGEAT